MTEGINAAIVEYIVTMRRYKEESFWLGGRLDRRLDWMVLQMCVFLTLPPKCGSEFKTAEEYLEKFRDILWFWHVEKDQVHQGGEKKEYVWISGYDGSAERKHVSCFYMLSLLLYSHVVFEDEKEAFLRYMILYPFCYKTASVWEDEEQQKEMLHQFEITGMDIDKENGGRTFEIVLKFWKKYEYDKYLSNINVLEIKRMSEEGLAILDKLKPSDGRTGECTS